MQAQGFYELPELDFSMLDTSIPCEFLSNDNSNVPSILIYDKAAYDDANTLFSILQNDGSICLASHLSFIDDMELYSNIYDDMNSTYTEEEEEVLEIAVLPSCDGLDAENTTLIIQWLLYILKNSAVYEYMGASV